MKAGIVAGGFVEDGFTLHYIREQKLEVLYAVDRGLEFFDRTGIRPDYIVGDFDSVKLRVLERYRRERPDLELLNPVKDDTDSQHALKMALEAGCEEIHFLGGTGSRIDHVLGNLQLLGICLREGVRGLMADPYNRIRLINRETRILREHQFGKFVSLIPFTPQVTGITLTGFKYPLTNHTMSGYFVEGASPVSGISNEIREDVGVISLKSGILVLVEARDSL